MGKSPELLWRLLEEEAPFYISEYTIFLQGSPIEIQTLRHSSFTQDCSFQSRVLLCGPI